MSIPARPEKKRGEIPRARLSREYESVHKTVQLFRREMSEKTDCRLQYKLQTSLTCSSDDANPPPLRAETECSRAIRWQPSKNCDRLRRASTSHSPIRA